MVPVKACGKEYELRFVLLDDWNHDVVEGVEIGLIVSSIGKRNVHGVSFSLSLANFVYEACSWKTGGILMQAHKENLIGFIEDFLSCISVMSVYIENKKTLKIRIAKKT